MKRNLIFAFLFLSYFIAFPDPSSHAQKTPKTLTILYSNNINGEVEPCPT